MNRITRYEHSYDCECDLCRNCEATTPMVLVPLSEVQQFYWRGRRDEARAWAAGLLVVLLGAAVVWLLKG